MTRDIERRRHKVDNGPEMRTRSEEDRLSSLPDEIIHHILSFIDTKFAVQTCVLSSRWKLIWTFLPHLNLASCQFRTLPKFSKFVNRVLSRRNNYTEISTVNLNLTRRVKQNIIEKIAIYAFSHNVQKININFGIPKGDDHFPPFLFDSESLKHLSLSTDDYAYGPFSCGQSPWNFPALTSLDLKNIRLCYDTINLDLFSKCVNLKNLTLDNCSVRGLGVMQIFCPRLLKLTLDSVWISKIELLTPNLTSFYYKVTTNDSFSLSTNGLNYLDSVTIEMSIYDVIFKEHRQRDAPRLLSMLQELKDTKNLRLHLDVIEFLSTVPDTFEHQPSPFSNLECLKIKCYQRCKSVNSTMINRVIKFLVSSSSNANVIMEIPKELSHFLITSRRDRAWLASLKRSWQELYKLAEILSQEMTDPHTRQGLEDVKEKLAVQCQQLDLPPRWSIDPISALRGLPSSWMLEF